MKIGRQERKIHTFCPAGEECRWITHWCLSHILFHRKEGRSVKETSLSLSVGQKDLWNEYLFRSGIFEKTDTHSLRLQRRERDSCPWKSRDSRRNRDIISSDSQSTLFSWLPIFFFPPVLLFRIQCLVMQTFLTKLANAADDVTLIFAAGGSYRSLFLSAYNYFFFSSLSLDSFFRVKELLNQHKTVARLLYFFLVSHSRQRMKQGWAMIKRLFRHLFYFFLSHRISHHLSTKESKVDLFLVVCLCINGPSPLFLSVSLMFDASTCHLKSNSWERRRQRNL